MYIFKILYEYFKDYKLTVIIYIIFTILSFPLEAIVIPQIYSKFFDILNSNKHPTVDVFIKYISLVIVIQIIVNASNSLTTYIESYAIPALNHYLINYIFKNLLRKYENSVTEIELGKITARLSTIPSFVKEFMTDFLVWIFPRLFTILLINIYFFYINFSLGIISLIMLVLFFYITFKYSDSCTKLSFERHNLFEEHTQNTQDLLSNSQSIYAAGSTNLEIKNYDINTKKYTSKFKENLMCLNNINILSGVLIVFLFIALNILTTYLYFKKKISYTNLIAIFITILYYVPCITTISLILPSIIHSIGPLKSIDSFVEDLYNINKQYDDLKLDKYPQISEDIDESDIKNLNKNTINEYIIKQLQKQHELKNKKHNISTEYYNDNSIKLNSGTIIINNLTFGYNSNNNIFKNFYLTIKDKESIAILGQSGNGKSTLIKLIMGYYKVPNGIIYIDGKDINSYDITELRKQISYVSQNTKLFNMSVLENIQYGNNKSKEDIEKLIKKINIQNIFTNLKDGLETNAGIEGSNLSGGQRQMIQILRNMLKDNKIVIFDEPTSAIDKNNTQNVINAIKELGKDKTLIIVTHDDELLSLVNRVIKISSGKIIEDNYI